MAYQLVIDVKAVKELELPAHVFSHWPYVQVHATQRATKTYERRETPAFKKSAEGYVPKQEEEGLLHLAFDQPDPVSLTIEVCILKGLSGIETVSTLILTVPLIDSNRLSPVWYPMVPSGHILLRTIVECTAPPAVIAAVAAAAAAAEAEAEAESEDDMPAALNISRRRAASSPNPPPLRGMDAEMARQVSERRRKRKQNAALRRTTLTTMKDVVKWDSDGVATVADAAAAIMDAKIRHVDPKDNVDDQMLGAGELPGVEVWRVADFGLAKLQEYEHGVFSTTDSYVVLSTTESGNGNLHWEVFFWVGSQAPVDKKTIASFKALELCRFLSNAYEVHVKQRRETEGEESPEFLVLFNGELQQADPLPPMRGRASSALKPVARRTSINYKARLLAVEAPKGGTLSVHEVSRDLKELRSDRVMILDTGGPRIFQWRGANASHKTRARAFEVCFSMRRERIAQAGSCEIETIEEGEHNEAFMQALTLPHTRSVQSLLEASDDEADDDGLGVDSMRLTFHGGLLDLTTPLADDIQEVESPESPISPRRSISTATPSQHRPLSSSSAKGMARHSSLSKLFKPVSPATDEEKPKKTKKSSRKSLEAGGSRSRMTNPEPATPTSTVAAAAASVAVNSGAEAQTVKAAGDQQPKPQESSWLPSIVSSALNWFSWGSNSSSSEESRGLASNPELKDGMNRAAQIMNVNRLSFRGAPPLAIRQASGRATLAQCIAVAEERGGLSSPEPDDDDDDEAEGGEAGSLSESDDDTNSEGSSVHLVVGNGVTEEGEFFVDDEDHDDGLRFEDGHLDGDADVEGDANGHDSSGEADFVPSEPSLYRVGYVSGELHVSRVSGVDSSGVDLGAPSVDKLVSSGVFILDCYTEIFLWVGRKSAGEVRSAGMTIAQAISKKLHRPDWVSTTTVLEGQEPVLFKAKFPGWVEKDAATHQQTVRKSQMPAPKIVEQPSPQLVVDHAVKEMVTLSRRHESDTGIHYTVRGPSESSLASNELGLEHDDGNGLTVVWEVTRDGLVSVPTDYHGHFWSHRCYLVLYGFVVRGAHDFALFFWQGDHASERDYVFWKMCLFPTKKAEWEAEIGKIPREVRVRQRREPIHFFRIFRQRYIVHIDFDRLRELRREQLQNLKAIQRDVCQREAGAAASVADDLDEDLRAPELLPAQSNMHLFHVRGHGNSVDDIHAVEVEPHSSCLNSSDCFIGVRTAPSANPMVWMWVGKGSSLDEQECTAMLAVALKEYEGMEPTNQIRVVEEGAGEWKWSARAFYRALGGRTYYASNEFLLSPKDSRPTHQWYPRMFLCHENSLDHQHKLTVESLSPFSQHDLNKSSVIILDAHYMLYVWYGEESSYRLQNLAAKIATTYASSTRGASAQCPIFVEQQGDETLQFKATFHGWLDWHSFTKGYVDPREVRLRERAKAGLIGDMVEYYGKVSTPEAATGALPKTPITPTSTRARRSSVWGGRALVAPTILTERRGSRDGSGEFEYVRGAAALELLSPRAATATRTPTDKQHTAPRHTQPHANRAPSPMLGARAASTERRPTSGSATSRPRRPSYHFTSATTASIATTATTATPAPRARRNSGPGYRRASGNAYTMQNTGGYTPSQLDEASRRHSEAAALGVHLPHPSGLPHYVTPARRMSPRMSPRTSPRASDIRHNRPQLHPLRTPTRLPRSDTSSPTTPTPTSQGSWEMLTPGVAGEAKRKSSA